MKKLEFNYSEGITAIVSEWMARVRMNKVVHLFITMAITLFLVLNFVNSYVEITFGFAASLILVVWLLFFVMTATTHKLKIFAYDKFTFDEDTRFGDITTDFGSDLLSKAMKMDVYEFNLTKISEVIDGEFDKLLVEFNSIGAGTEIALIRQVIERK